MPTGRRIFVHSTVIENQPAPGLHYPYVIESLTTGDLVVGDASERLMLISSQGTWKKTIGTFGRMDGEFAHPQGIAAILIGSDEFIFVADTQNNRVQKLKAATWQVVATATRAGPLDPPAFQLRGAFPSGPSRLSQPHGVAATADALYVTDTLNHRIVVYDASVSVRSREMEKLGVGTPHLKWDRNIGVKGREPGNFDNPKGIMVWPKEPAGHPIAAPELIVADSTNHRVQFISPDTGRFLRGVGGKERGTGRSSTELFNFPSDITVSPDGRYLFVAGACMALSANPNRPAAAAIVCVNDSKLLHLLLLSGSTDQRAVTILCFHALHPMNILLSSGGQGPQLAVARPSLLHTRKAPYSLCMGQRPGVTASKVCHVNIAEQGEHSILELTLTFDDFAESQPQPKRTVETLASQELSPLKWRLPTHRTPSQQPVATFTPSED